jgi:hypothetical protein
MRSFQEVKKFGNSIVTYLGVELYTGYGLDIGFILNVIITLSLIHPLYWSLQHTLCLHQSLLGNSFQQWLLLCSVFTRRFLVTNFNNRDSSASVVMPLLSGECP